MPAARTGDGMVALGASPAARPASGLSEAGFAGLSAAAARRGRARRHQPRRRSTGSSRRSTFSPRTVELDRAQPGGTPGSTANPPFAPYRARHVTPALIDRGRARYAANLGRLSEIGRRYGVPPAMLIAIWGKETSYGAIMGDFDLLNSLASLAYEGRRRAALHRRVHRHPAA